MADGRLSTGEWAGAKYTKEGIPDILACVDGHFFGIEDKSKTGKPKMLQLKNLEWVRDAGGFGILLYPDDFENLKRFITDGLDNLSPWQLDWYNGNINLQEDWVQKIEKNHF